MAAESVWRSRLRWRLRGAMLWPAFALLTLADAFLLGRLPIAGDGGTAFIPALLLGFFFNLVAVTLHAPGAARLLRRRRGDLPRVVAVDRAGTALLVMVTLGLLAGGLAHRSSVQEARHDLLVQQLAAQRFIAREAPAEFRPGAAATTSIKLEEDLFRTCAPGDDDRHWFCVLVRTDASPPGVRVDDSRESNEVFARQGGFR